ncbi:MAG TPA: type II secretion system protein [Candidatus Paceibacterota bacterium]|nr:type II secretion system protein [Candidatus Paceibacterota bacterium]
MRSSYKGFTLIELLVVIAIIGVLSSIVLSALNTARNKGNDAAVKSNLDGARSQSELFYDSNGNKYVVTPGGATDVCSATGSVGSPAVKGIYAQVLAAAQSAGLQTVNTTIGTSGSVNISTCHACFAGEASTDCTGTRDGWAAEAPLKNVVGAVYCVDSSGNSTTTVTSLGPGDTKCG